MRKGFTLIELLLVVVIIGIVAAMVLPKFGDVKEKAYVASMKNDLRNLANAQEFHQEETGSYEAVTPAANTIPTLGFYASDNVLVEVVENATQDGYTATATAPGVTNESCVLRIGPDADQKIDCN